MMNNGENKFCGFEVENSLTWEFGMLPGSGDCDTFTECRMPDVGFVITDRSLTLLAILINREFNQSLENDAQRRRILLSFSKPIRKKIILIELRFQLNIN